MFLTTLVIEQKPEGDVISLNSKEAMGTRTRQEIEAKLLFGKQIEAQGSVGPVNWYSLPAMVEYPPVVIVTAETAE